MKPDLVGQSAPIQKVRHLVKRFAASRSPVLLLGESGTGKEVVARTLYEANPIGRFVPIDCGSLVGPLMESELFGHTRGAFTGADANKRGLIEMADGGTAFFDEIGDLPLELQVKLLRLLQEREFRPVGSLQTKRIEMRVIAATHRDLEQRLAEGRFRQDLYFRLNVGRIRLPALRERKDDIPLLIDHFLDVLGASIRPSAKALELMLAYDWPGNVRELKNAIERAVMLNSGPVFDLPDLPTAVLNFDRAADLERLAVAIAKGKGESAPVFRSSSKPAVIPLLETEKHAIMEALGFTKGDRGKAARLLKISRTTLYRKLKEYQITD
jgi:DNA-binding NtrC family response regulator